MTAAYMTRCVYLTFFGEYRGGARRTTPHESTRPHDHRARCIDPAPTLRARGRTSATG